MEIELVKQIALRSHSFFQALTNIGILHDEIATACRKIAAIRRHMKEVVDQQLKKVLVVPQSQYRKHNIARILDILEIMSRVHRADKLIDALLQIKDYVGASRLISETKTIINTKLNGITCVK